MRVNLLAHRNEIAERDVVENKRFGFAPSIAFGLGTPTQLTLSYLTQYENNIPDYGFPFGPDGRPVRVDRENFYGLKEDDYERTYVNIGTGRLDHRFNDHLSLRNTLRFSHVHREVAPTLPQLSGASTVNRSRPIRDTKEVILSSQTDLTAKFETFKLNHSLTTGIEFSYETVDVLRYSQTTAANGLPATNLFNPTPGDSLSGVSQTLAADSFTASRGFGIYAADTLKLNDYFDIIGGIRWDYFSTRFDDERNVAAAMDFNNIDRMFSYRGGLVFKPTLSQSYYFSYGTSFNPSAEAVALAANTQETSPEKKPNFRNRRQAGFFWRRIESHRRAISHRQNRCAHAG